MNKKAMIPGIITGIILGIAFLLLCYFKAGCSVKFTAALGLIAFIGIILQAFNSSKSDSASKYFSKLFGYEKTNSKRVYEYDWLRVIAVVLVITTHTISADVAMNFVVEEHARYVYTVVYICALVCNTIYLMLSGGLLMEYKEESVSSFYIRRASRVVLPMLGYYLIYMKFMGQPFSLQFVWSQLVNLYCNNLTSSPHYGLMYMILGMYVVIPFIRYMTKDMPYKTLSALVIVTLVFNGLVSYVNLQFAINPVVVSWTAVGIVGYWVTRKETRKYDYLLIAAGLASICITALLIKKGLDPVKYCRNLAPTMTLMGCGIFALVFKVKPIFTKNNPIIASLSKYSFGLILIHWLILHAYVRGPLNLHVISFSGWGILLEIVITLVLSYVIAFIYENVVMIVLNKAYDCLFSRWQ